MVHLLQSDGPRIPRFYARRSILITGGTGFMGKVLVERLLSTCPDIGSVFLLVRQKRDVNPQKRLTELKESQVFEALRQSNPLQLEKLSLIPGDLTRPELGLSAHSLNQLREVSIVFHSAAMVKFNEALRTAVEINVRSVTKLLDICDRLQHLVAFVYVSTAYSNAELSVVEEKVYPPPVELSRLLAFVDAVPDEILEQVTAKYIAPKPNTYTFTKALAEHAVARRAGGGYSLAIFRPTIVVSSLRHPFPGWMENLNGPGGVVVGAGKGLLRTVSGVSRARADMLPVDIAIDTLIAVAWETAVDKLPTARVYNCTTGENPITWAYFHAVVINILREYPLDQALWYPLVIPVENRYAHAVLELMLQTIPLHLIEYSMRLLGVRTRRSLITTSEKLRAMNKALSFFASHEWSFVNNNARALRERLAPEDAATYNLHPRSIRWDEHLVNLVRGARRFVLREEERNLAAARGRVCRLKMLHYGLMCLLTLLLLKKTGGTCFLQQVLSRTLPLPVSVCRLLSPLCCNKTE